MVSEFLTRRFRSKKKHHDAVTEFIGQDPARYEIEFGQVSTHIVFKPWVLCLWCSAMWVAEIGYFRKTGDHVLLLIVTLFTLICFTLRFLRFPWPRLTYLRPYFLAIAYLALNLEAHKRIIKYGDQAVTDPQLGGLWVVSIIVTAMMMVTPFVWRNIWLNLPVMAWFVFETNQIALSRGFDFFRMETQAVITGGILSYVMTLIYRYRVYFTFQEKALRDRAETIRMGAERLDRIFQSIDQAIFTVVSREGKLFILREDRSPQCSSVLGFSKDPGENGFRELFSESLQLEPDSLADMEETMKAMIGEAVLTFEVNECHLPKTLVFKHPEERNLSMTYAPLMDGNVVSGILVTAADVTEITRERNKSQQAAARIERLMRLLELGRERGVGGLRLMDELLQKSLDGIHRLKAILADAAGADVQKTVQEVFVALHTLKGNGRTLGFSEVANGCHLAEGTLDLWRKPGHNKIDEETAVQQLSMHMAELSSAISFIKTDSLVLGWQKRDELVFHANVYKSAQREDGWEGMRRRIMNGEDQDGHLEAFLAPGFIRASRLPERLLPMATEAACMAKKEAPAIHYSGGEIWLASEVFDRLISILPHILANAIDHGIEPADVREHLQKPRQGRIDIKENSEAKKGFVEISIFDDGHGINPDGIAGVALNRGILSRKEIDGMNDLEKVGIILMHGFSSRHDVTELSGRGVGLSAVKEALLEISGDLELRLGSHLGEGRYRLIFVMRIPASSVWL